MKPVHAGINPKMMRKFGQTPRKSWWLRLWQALVNILFFPGEYTSSGGHYDRMQQRRRVTKFDK